jgi:hypothetical protein
LYTALRATSRTLSKFLETSFLADPLLSGFFGGGMVVSLATPQEMNEKPAEGLSVWLYRIIRDEQRLERPSGSNQRHRTAPPPLLRPTTPDDAGDE